MLKKFLFSFFCLSFIFLGSIYGLLNTTWFVQKIVPRIIQGQIKGFSIESLRCQSQHFKLSGRLELNQLEINIKNGGILQRYAIDQLVLENLYALKGSPVGVRAIKVNVDLPTANIRNVNFDGSIYLKGKSVRELNGIATVASASFDPYQVNHLRADIQGDGQKIRLLNFIALGYGGKLQGEISLDYLRGLAYSITIHFIDLDAKKLRTANSDLFSQLNGQLNGTVKIQGDLTALKFIDMDLSMAAGGTIKAALLGFLIQYIPQSVQRQELERLAKANGDVSLEKAEIHSQSLSDEKIASQVNLESKKFNLDVHLGIDTNVSGGFNSLLNYFKGF